VLKAWKSTSGRSVWLATMPDIWPSFTGMDGGSVFDGLEPALCFHRALDAIVFRPFEQSFDSRSCFSQLLEAAIILKLFEPPGRVRSRVTLCVGALTVIAFLVRAGARATPDVFVNRLPLVVVLGMSLAVRPGDGLRRFIGLEPQIARLVFVGFGVIAAAVVAQHEVVVRLQILGNRWKASARIP